jgi:hypothetical protein
MLAFSNGMPTAATNSTSAVIPIMRNQDNSKCPDDCFRPVGLAWDGKGRLFMTSDSTGEIYVITRSDGTSVNGSTPTANPSSPSPSPTQSAATIGARPRLWLFMFVLLGAVGNAVM